MDLKKGPSREGACGMLHSAKCKRTSELRAIKVVSKEKLTTPGKLQALEQEVAILCQLDHHNIVPMYEVLCPSSDAAGRFTCSPMLSMLPPPSPHAHTGAGKSVLESANPRMDSQCASGCPSSTARATAPSLGRPTPGVVKQDKSSGGSVDITKTRSDPQRVRMSSGERPIGAAKGKQSDTEALCPPPPPPPPVSNESLA